MRLPSRIFPAFLFSFFLGVNPANASYISMVTNQRVETRENSVVVHVTVTNKGDEAAYNIQISGEMEGEVKKGPLHERLEVNQVLEEKMEFSVKFEKAGKYPVIVSVDYTDLNRYPFTAISIGEVNFKETLIGRVSGTIEAKPFSKTGKVKVTIKNLENKEHTFDLRLVLPREFTADREKDSLTVPPGEEGSVKYTLKNISALQDSQYQIFALITYEDGEKHFMHPLGYTVEIVPFKSFIGQYYSVFGVAAFILLVIFVTLNLRKRSRQTSLP